MISAPSPASNGENQQQPTHQPPSDALRPRRPSLTARSSKPAAPPARRGADLKTHAAPEVTVLFIDIKGFTAQCAAMPAGLVGQWVAAFYDRVSAVAAAHGVSRLETRGDCCVCVAGAEGAVPALDAPAPADRRASQAARALAFAAALHRSLSDTPLGTGGAPPVQTRIGVATGAAAFLVGRVDGRPFASAQGPAVRLAARMEALAAPGLARVHRSAVDRWAAEAGRPPPPTAGVECEGPELEEAVVYDCAAAAFRARPAQAPAAPETPMPPPPVARPAGRPAGGLRVSASALF